MLCELYIFSLQKQHTQSLEKGQLEKRPEVNKLLNLANS